MAGIGLGIARGINQAVDGFLETKKSIEDSNYRKSLRERQDKQFAREDAEWAALDEARAASNAVLEGYKPKDPSAPADVAPAGAEPAGGGTQAHGPHLGSG